jgi:CHASE2 domain-containing sensor protein
MIVNKIVRLNMGKLFCWQLLIVSNFTFAICVVLLIVGNFTFAICVVLLIVGNFDFVCNVYSGLHN